MRAYSIYEAKTKLSEIIRQVKRHRSVTITERGNPVAEVVPLRRAQSLEERIQVFIDSGELIAARNPGPQRMTLPVVRHKGALKRFLTERD